MEEKRAFMEEKRGGQSENTLLWKKSAKEKTEKKHLQFF